MRVMRMTSDRWMDKAGNELPDEGDIVYFVYLHLDTAKYDRPHPVIEGECIYAVAGKPRPMLVVERLEREYGGRRRFMAFRFTSKNQDGRGNPRKRVIPIGRCISPDQNSFLVLEPLFLPENLLHEKHGSPSVLRRLDPLGFGNILRIAGHYGLTSTDEPRGVKPSE